MAKTWQEMSADTRAVRLALSQLKEGDTITWVELNKSVPGRTLQGAHAYIQQSARRSLLTDERMVFDCQRGVGVRRCTDDAKVTGSAATTTKVRRALKRGVKRLNAVENFEALPRELQVQHQLKKTVWGMQLHLLTAKALAKISARVTETKNDLPPKVALALFGKIED